MKQITNEVKMDKRIIRSRMLGIEEGKDSTDLHTKIHEFMDDFADEFYYPEIENISITVLFDELVAAFTFVIIEKGIRPND